MQKEFSNISGFYKMPIKERREQLKVLLDLTDKDLEGLGPMDAPQLAVADKMVENVVGTFDLPVGIATNFRINGRDYLIPMATEEPSVVAAASNSAKVARETGGFVAETTDPVMIGQIQVVKVPDIATAMKKVTEAKSELLARANEQDPILVKSGGGARDLDLRVLPTRMGDMLIVHLMVDCRDAMGANSINTMCEALAPAIGGYTGGQVLLRILSNLAKFRLARAKATFPGRSLATEGLTGEQVVERIILAQVFAESDPFRCATHNKGVMNGVEAVVRATGNDTRAVEAGAHAYAALEGCYGPLTEYEKDPSGDLVGSIELPLPVGLVGGATAVHPCAKACVKMLGVRTASELAGIIAAVGLAQNFGALRAMVTVGIQNGHMRLHARNLAVTAGATPDVLEEVVKRLVDGGKVRMDIAVKIVDELRSGRNGPKTGKDRKAR